MGIIIYGRFNRPKTIPSPAGDGILRQYEVRIVDGKRVISVASESSLVDKVKESFPDTLIYNILARHERGDVTALNQVSGQYMDVVGMPTTLAQAQQMLIDIRNDFDKLPQDVRKHFNNSVDEFIESVSTGKAAEFFQAQAAANNPAADTVPASDTKEGE